jgi:hypothetical protein
MDEMVMEILREDEGLKNSIWHLKYQKNDGAMMGWNNEEIYGRRNRMRRQKRREERKGIF